MNARAWVRKSSVCRWNLHGSQLECDSTTSMAFLLLANVLLCRQWTTNFHFGMNIFVQNTAGHTPVPCFRNFEIAHSCRFLYFWFGSCYWFSWWFYESALDYITKKSAASTFCTYLSQKHCISTCFFTITINNAAISSGDRIKVISLGSWKAKTLL